MSKHFDGPEIRGPVTPIEELSRKLFQVYLDIQKERLRELDELQKTFADDPEAYARLAKHLDAVHKAAESALEKPQERLHKCLDRYAKMKRQALKEKARPAYLEHLAQVARDAAAKHRQGP
jgi:hypothetical protein